MFCACFISGLRYFTWHFNFRYFAHTTYNRNLDSLNWRVHSGYVVCRLHMRMAKKPFRASLTWLILTNTLFRFVYFIRHLTKCNKLGIALTTR